MRIWANFEERQKISKTAMILYLQPGIEPGSADQKPTVTTSRPSRLNEEREISKLYKDLTLSDQISLPLWNLSQILMVITMMLEKDLCAKQNVNFNQSSQRCVELGLIS